MPKALREKAVEIAHEFEGHLGIVKTGLIRSNKRKRLVPWNR